MDEQIKNLDVMIATHPDEDHIGGLSGALNYATVETVYSPVTEHDTKTFKSLLKYIGKQGVTLTVPDDATVFKLGSAEVEILGPVNEDKETNNNSIVTKITYGSNSFLFMGDAEISEEFSLIKGKKNIRCDVIKIGHHGSNSSTTYSLINNAVPQYAVISVGKDNSYGHPTDAVLHKLDIRKIEIFRTDLQGDIYCSSDGVNITFTTEKRDASKIEELGVIPKGTTYVCNTNSKKFHIPTCDSVSDMAEKNKLYSTQTAEELIEQRYEPCKRCNPAKKASPKSNTDIPNSDSSASAETPAKNDGETSVVPAPVPAPEPAPAPVGTSYVLNTNTMKFHKPGCSSVSDMSAKNRSDVTASRDEIIAQGYVPCKRCNP